MSRPAAEAVKVRSLEETKKRVLAALKADLAKVRGRKKQVEQDAERIREQFLGRKARKGVDRRTDLGKFIDYLPRLNGMAGGTLKALQSYNDRAERYGRKPFDPAHEKALQNFLAELGRKTAFEGGLEPFFARDPEHDKIMARLLPKKRRGAPSESADVKALCAKARADLEAAGFGRAHAADLVDKAKGPLRQKRSPQSKALGPGLLGR